MWAKISSPNTLPELLGNETIGLLLNDLVSSKNKSSLLITGPPGCGKTTAVNLFINKCFPDPYQRDELTLTIHASINRSTSATQQENTTTESIPNFIKMQPSFPSPHPKVIVIYDMEYWMENNILALRSIMDESQETTRFILVMHNQTDAIEAIQSRCLTLAFQQPTPEQLIPYLEKTWLTLTTTPSPPHIINHVASQAKSLRSALNQLQMIAYGAPAPSLAAHVAHWFSLPPIEAIKYLEKNLRDYRPQEILEQLIKQLKEVKNFELIKQIMTYEPTYLGLMLLSLRTPPSLISKVDPLSDLIDFTPS